MEGGIVREGEVEFSTWPAEFNGGGVVGTCGIFGGVECTEPDSGGTFRVADLGSPFSPWALPDASVILLQALRTAAGVVVMGSCGGGGRGRSGEEIATQAAVDSTDVTRV